MNETTQLEGVGGNPVPTLGHTKMGVGIGTGMYMTIVMMSA